MHDETKKRELVELLILRRSLLLKQNPTKKKTEPTKCSESIARMNLSKIKR